MTVHVWMKLDTKYWFWWVTSVHIIYYYHTYTYFSSKSTANKWISGKITEKQN